MMSKWGYSSLAMLNFCLGFRGGTLNWLPGSAVMVSSWQMLRGSRSPIVVAVLISRRWLKYVYFVVRLEGPGLNVVFA
jgi:hypothetical protein